jgi:hypothetical protein
MIPTDFCYFTIASLRWSSGISDFTTAATNFLTTAYVGAPHRTDKRYVIKKHSSSFTQGGVGDLV